MPARKEKGGVNGFHHVAIRVKDFDETVRFYKEGLGLKERLAWGEGDGRAILLDAGNDNCVEIFAGGKSAPVEGNIMHFALRTGRLRRRAEARAGGRRDGDRRAEDRGTPGPNRPGLHPHRLRPQPRRRVVEFFQDMSG